MSAIKVAICFRRRSTEDSFPVLSRVVIASVAMDRLWSEMRPSISMLQQVTEEGCDSATFLRARIEAKRSVGFEDDKKSCKTETAG